MIKVMKVIAQARNLAIIGFALAACAHAPQPPRVVTQEVRIPVPVKCDAKVGPRPAYPDTRDALKGADAGAMLAMLYAGRLIRDGYIGELETAIQGCAK